MTTIDMSSPNCPSSRSVSLKARYVFPVDGEPIAGGVVTVESGRIAAIGPAGRMSLGSQIVDFGSAAILPGLINAHAHLDLSDVEQPLGSPGMSMTDWIRQVIAHRREPSFSASQAVAKGVEESLSLGTTTVADIVQPGWRADVSANPRLRVAAFMELIAPVPERIEEAERAAAEHLQSPGDRLVGLSPHAPYTVHPRLLDRLIELSASREVPLAMHLAESREELQLLRDGDGPFRRLLEEMDSWREGLFGGLRPLDYLRKLSAAHRSLVIHGNYLDAEEMAYIGTNADRMSVVYCPRTHEHFAHAAYPLEQMLARGIRVCLGTDSRASTPDLSVLSEMRTVARLHPAIPGPILLELCTANPAAALGLIDSTGTLTPGKQADLTVVPLPNTSASDPHELLLNSSRVAPMIFRGDHPLR